MKGFYRSSQAYYHSPDMCRNGVKCDIMVGDYVPGGGTTGEFAIEWVELCGRVIPQLRAWHDSWKVLSSMPELLNVLANTSTECVSEEMMYVFLLGLGYEDLTPYTRGSDRLATV